MRDAGMLLEVALLVSQKDCRINSSQAMDLRMEWLVWNRGDHDSRTLVAVKDLPIDPRMSLLSTSSFHLQTPSIPCEVNFSVALTSSSCIRKEVRNADNVCKLVAHLSNVSTSKLSISFRQNKIAVPSFSGTLDMPTVTFAAFSPLLSIPTRNSLQLPDRRHLV
jgi:hypothetical protein